jgi:hypothetical protein
MLAVLSDLQKYNALRRMEHQSADLICLGLHDCRCENCLFIGASVVNSTKVRQQSTWSDGGAHNGAREVTPTRTYDSRTRDVGPWRSSTTCNAWAPPILPAILTISVPLKPSGLAVSSP